MPSIVALLTIRDRDAFDKFERQAVAIMKLYGGVLDTAFRPKESDAEPRVDEVHVLKFPDLDAFERYKADATLLSLAALRSQAISNTVVYVSGEDKHYAD